MSVALRNPTLQDADAAAEVLNEHSRRLHGKDDVTTNELAEDWAAPELDFPDDVLLAETNGTAVGYADVMAHGDSAWLDVRGTDEVAYDPLLGAIVERAAAKGKEHVRGWASEGDTGLRDAYERAGFRPFRHSFRMEIDLVDDVPEPSWPDGHVVRGFQEGEERRVYRAQMDSFADTWGFTEHPFESWAHWHMGALFQPEHWFVVESGDHLAGIALCRMPETEPGLGWVDILGVVPACRRRGLAIALLQHVFGHFADLGLRQVALSVDAENPTGAVGPYERAGMHVARKYVRYELHPEGDTASGVSKG
jgi:mycothiol synthase